MLILHAIQLFLSDDATAFSKSIGWTKGERTGRYAIVIDHGKVVYAENESGGGVTVSPKDEMYLGSTLTICVGLQCRSCTREALSVVERETCIAG